MAAIASIYFPAFPIWVRRQLSPRERLIAIHEGDRIVACSEVLSGIGIEPGDTLKHARLLCPRVVLHPRDLREEEAIWEDILYLLGELTPRVESVRPGWALVEPRDGDRLKQAAHAIGARLGIGTRRFSSMLAALHAPDGGTMELTVAGTRRLLDESPTRLLAEIGFDPVTTARLTGAGMTTLGRLWRLTRVHLIRLAGDDGDLLFRLLHPDGEEPPVEEFRRPPMIAVSHELHRPTADPAALLPALDELVHRASLELAGAQARLLTLRLAGRAGGVLELRRILKAPTSRPYPLYVAAEAIFRTLSGEGLPVERITIELGGLTPPELSGQEPSGQVSGAAEPVSASPGMLETVRALH